MLVLGVKLKEKQKEIGESLYCMALVDWEGCLR